MRRKRISALLFFILFFLLCLHGIDSIAGENLYKMSGKLTAIEKDHNTVVIEVLLANDQLFTVGGPLSDGAILKEEGQ